MPRLCVLLMVVLSAPAAAADPFARSSGSGAATVPEPTRKGQTGSEAASGPGAASGTSDRPTRPVAPPAGSEVPPPAEGDGADDESTPPPSPPPPPDPRVETPGEPETAPPETAEPEGEPEPEPAPPPRRRRQRRPPPPPPPLVAPWVPRYAFVGAFINSSVTPQVRIGWDVALTDDQRPDTLTAFGELGGGYATSFPSVTLSDGTKTKPNFLYQHMLLVGLGYRGSRGALHWGIQVGVGPMLYGAHYVGISPERRTVATVEGRAEIGYRINGKVAVGLSAGFNSPIAVPSGSLVGPSVGGALVGIFANWR